MVDRVGGMTRRRMLGLAGGAACASASPQWLRGQAGVAVNHSVENASDTLRAHAMAKELLTGCAVVPSLLDKDEAYTRLVKEQANILVAENAMKWGPLRPSPTTFDFDEADRLVEFAEANGMQVRGHNLCWHRQIPKWFDGVATTGNAKELLAGHIETVAGRYAGKMHSWDVVNEAIELKDGRPDGLRISPWLKLIGGEYIELAFRAARQADPRALLTYNDYGIEAEDKASEAKRAALLRLLRWLKQRHVPIDALGVQSHIQARRMGDRDTGLTYGKGLMQMIAEVRGMGMQVFVTEMDVNDRHLGPAVVERDQAVAETYERYLETVLRDPAVKAVLTWGITDKYTWLNGEDSRADKVPERPLPFDREYQAKQAFFAMREAYDRRPLRGV